MDNFMELGEALEIVYELAKENALDPDYAQLEGGGLEEEADRQRVALNVVHDFIVNNFGEEEHYDGFLDPGPEPDWMEELEEE